MRTAQGNPWKGVVPYTIDDTHPFNGRNEDIESFYEVIETNDISTLYGRSGIGKTSLLNAGLFPLLKVKGYHPISIRLGADCSADDSFARFIVSKLQVVAQCQNNEMWPLTEGLENELEFLWCYFAYHRFFVDGQEIVPVIVLDQFEEILRNSKEKASLLIRQLSATLHDGTLADGTDYTIGFRFIISIREDDLYLLEDCLDDNQIEVLKRGRYRLRPIDVNKAKEEIIFADRKYFDATSEEQDEIAQLITDGATQDKQVSTLLLSLLCSMAYERSQPGKITFEKVKQIISDNPLLSFYLEAIKNIPDDVVDWIEDNAIDGERRKTILRSKIPEEYTSHFNTLCDENNRLHLFAKSSSNVSRDESIELLHDRLALSIGEHLLSRLKEREQIKKNIEYNRRLRLISQNVLNRQGRQLINNALDFGELRTMLDDKYPDDDILRYSILADRYLKPLLMEDTNAIRINQDIIQDTKLSNVSYQLFFMDDSGVRTSTIDGIYRIAAKYENNLITDVTFYGKGIKDGSINYDTPIYIMGGFCGIHQDYDNEGRVIRKIYLGEDGKPTKTIDNYSTIEFSYDTCSNPIETRYFIESNSEKHKCKHKDGNHGFVSSFDKAGNEIERRFFDEEGLPIKIMTGVWGKRLGYDEKCFEISLITNIGCDGEKIVDVDGYASVQLFYDEKGRETKELNLDINGNVWIANDLLCGSEIEYIDEKKIKIFNLIGLHQRGNNKDGWCEICIKADNNMNLREWTVFDCQGQPWFLDKDTKTQKMVFEYDDKCRVNKILFHDCHGSFVGGILNDFDKTGCHVLRQWFIDINGRIVKNDVYGDSVFGTENDLNIQEGLPILIRYINNHNQYVKNDNGVYAGRFWEDEKGRKIKQMFYDFAGTPMKDINGVLGCQYEYLDDTTMKEIYVDAEGIPMEDNDGVCYSIIEEKENIKLISFYDNKGRPSMGKGYYQIREETVDLDDGSKLKKTSYLDKNFTPIDDNSIVFNQSDERGRTIRSWLTDSMGELINDYGDTACYEISEYSDDGRIIRQHCIDENGDLFVDEGGGAYVEKTCDIKDRVVEELIRDKNGNPLGQSNGYEWIRYIYDDTENSKTTIYLDSDGEPVNNEAGYFYLKEVYDYKGRCIAVARYDAEKNMIGYKEEKEYVENERHVCAFYIRLKDANDKLVLQNNGVFVVYKEVDENERVLCEYYYDENKKPMCDNEEDYGIIVKYDDDSKTSLMMCLDSKHNIHNNQLGYAQKRIEYNDNGYIIKEQYFDVDGTGVIIDKGSCGLCYDRDENGNIVKVGYLDELGNTHNNSDGYAYREEFVADNGANVSLYYDLTMNPTFTKEDDCCDYGKAIVENENDRMIISLNAQGEIHTNAKGYAIKTERLREDGGILTIYKDKKNKNFVADDCGDYGTVTYYEQNGNVIIHECLDKNGNIHQNNLGFSKEIIVKDFSGAPIKLWYNLKGERVIPRQTRLNRLKDIIGI